MNRQRIQELIDQLKSQANRSPNEPKEPTAPTIKELRRELGVTQEQLAVKADLKHASIVSKAERGVVMPEVKTLEGLVLAFEDIRDSSPPAENSTAVPRASSQTMSRTATNREHSKASLRTALPRSCAAIPILQAGGISHVFVFSKQITSDDSSAAHPQGRPESERLIALLKSGEVDVILLPRKLADDRDITRIASVRMPVDARIFRFEKGNYRIIDSADLRNDEPLYVIPSAEAQGAEREIRGKTPYKSYVLDHPTDARNLLTLAGPTPHAIICHPPWLPQPIDESLDQVPEFNIFSPCMTWDICVWTVKFHQRQQALVEYLLELDNAITRLSATSFCMLPWQTKKIATELQAPDDWVEQFVRSCPGKLESSIIQIWLTTLQTHYNRS